jgi:hypothetical protein
VLEAPCSLGLAPFSISTFSAFKEGWLDDNKFEIYFPIDSDNTLGTTPSTVTVTFPPVSGSTTSILIVLLLGNPRPPEQHMQKVNIHSDACSQLLNVTTLFTEKRVNWKQGVGSRPEAPRENRVK